MTPRQYLKCIIWPREPVGEPGAQNHRYAIVGMLVTDEAIPEFDAPNVHGITEWVLDGQTFGLADILRAVRRREPKRPTGDATDVLLSLGLNDTWGI